MSDHPVTVGAAGVGGFIGLAHFANIVEPILADLSYVAALVVAAVTIFKALRK